jgi:hypothetical protein
MVGVVVHYHVGIRHYVTTDPTAYDDCGDKVTPAQDNAAFTAISDGTP